MSGELLTTIITVVGTLGVAIIVAAKYKGSGGEAAPEFMKAFTADLERRSKENKDLRADLEIAGGRLEALERALEEHRIELLDLHQRDRMHISTIRDLQSALEESRARIVELTQWGRFAEGDPPRTPPPWRAASA